MGSSSSARPSRPLLTILSSTRLGGPEVGHGGGHQQHVGVRELVARGGQQLGRGLDLDRPHARRRRERHVGGDQGHLGPAPGRLRGQRDAHASGRAVADVAHGVDRLARAAGGDEDPQPVRAARRPACRARPRPSRGCAAGSASRPTPHSPLRGEPAAVGLDDRRAARAQQAEVVARGGCSYMWLFIAGATHQRRGAGQRRAGQQVVREPVRRAWRACWPRRARCRTRRRAAPAPDARSGRGRARARPG